MASDTEIIQLLKNSNLRNTNTRQQVLRVFLDAGTTALSSYEIEQEFEKIDRITLYRTLKSFEEVGLIHQAVDISGKSKYALCFEQCTAEEHQHQHAHFYCTSCEKTTCLENVNIPPVELPEGFVLQDQQLALTGTCSDCQ